jgi:hypothetical protein
MIVNLKTQQLSGLEQVRSFMAGTDAVPFTTQAHQDRYQWAALSLKQFAYERLRRAERGLIVRFLCKVTGYSRAQVTRLIAQWRCRGRLTDRRGPPAAPFAKHYGAIELRLLAQIDSLHGTLSGPATKKLAERAFTVYKQPHYETLAGISVSHLYNLRRSNGYRRLNGPVPAAHSPHGHTDRGAAQAQPRWPTRLPARGLRAPRGFQWGQGRLSHQRG